MPLYEYRCADCRSTFQKLRPMSQAGAPTACAVCGSSETSLAISLFSAISRRSDGATERVRGTGGGCASCSSGSCATCAH